MTHAAARNRAEKDSVEPDVIGRAGQVLFRLGRRFGRRSIRQTLEGGADHAVELSRILVVQAIDDDSRGSERATTVGDVAERLGVEPSTASRLVADAIRDGYVMRSAAHDDARRAQLSLTDSGRTLNEAAIQFQRGVFERATATWPATEREHFAHRFIEFAEAVEAMHQNP